LSIFTVLFIGLESVGLRAASWLLYVPLYWTLLAVAIKRYHDRGRSGWWMLLLAIPLLGPAWTLWNLGFRKGDPVENRYGAMPNREELDYLTVADRGDKIVNDVTQLNPIEVARKLRPTSFEEAARAIIETPGPISVGGGHFSMGGQTASPGSLHLDMRGLNRVLFFNPQERWIRVEAGIRWCDIQRFVDPHDLAVKIMQTYANFTVAGSLSVNAHGRYIGLGPVILSVRAIKLILADGSVKNASPTENRELFFGAIGGYGGLGVIVEVELDLVENCRVKCVTQKLAMQDYLAFFRANVRDGKQAVFHNADLYPPHYGKVLAQTWFKTDHPITQTNRLMGLRSSFPLERYFFWAVSETPTGKWRREFILDPILFFRQQVHWRNYEAGYDAAELEPASRAHKTYVLQEYFVPIARFGEFVPKIADILNRHQVNAFNISVRHALADPGSVLAWAREEVFAFVLYYKQGTADHDRNRVGIWTRELIDAVLSVGGTYYLPYQPHATSEQFHRAYPHANDFFELKRKLDPNYRFRNALWDKYYAPTLRTEPEPPPTVAGSEFREVFNDVARRDGFYRFLQNIFHLYPEDRFHWLIDETCRKHANDKEIYKHVQAELPKIKPLLAMLTLALPALKKQKREMARQTLQLLGERTAFDGYLEIGSVGRYISELRKHVQVTGPIWITNDIAPTNGPGDIMERGQYKPLGTFLPLDYGPLDSKGIVNGSIDLATCFIGLHHAPKDRLDDFVRSLHRILRPGGMFIIRDHDCRTPEMCTFVSLVHTVFNAGLGVSCQDNDKEFKAFDSAQAWSDYITARGFRDVGARLLQANDPTDNTLMAFVKKEAS
jgi:FAD/FMN-containing dehydrogenase/SAM-dependent methyltransferase